MIFLKDVLLFEKTRNVRKGNDAGYFSESVKICSEHSHLLSSRFFISNNLFRNFIHCSLQFPNLLKGEFLGHLSMIELIIIFVKCPLKSFFCYALFNLVFDHIDDNKNYVIIFKVVTGLSKIEFKQGEQILIDRS